MGEPKNQSAPQAESQSPDSAYGSIDYTYQNKPSKKRNVFIGIAIVLVFAIGLFAGSVLFGHNDATEEAPEVNAQRIALTSSRVQQDLDAMEMPAPDLAQYAYITTDNIIGPRFGEVVVGDAEEFGVGNQATVTRKATAVATFRNKSVVVNVPVSLTYTYDSEGETWVAGELELGDPMAEPISAANAAAIVADLPALLGQTHPDEATLFEGAATKTTPALNAEGGQITVDLAKSTDEADYACTVVIAVSWSGEVGWVPAITSVSEVAETLKEQPESPEEADGTDAGSTGGSRDHYELRCTNGDLVELPGTVVAAGGGLQLRLDYLLTLTMDGRTYNLDNVGLVVDLADGGVSLIGKSVTVVGDISTAFAVGDAAVGVSAESVDVR